MATFDRYTLPIVEAARRRGIKVTAIPGLRSHALFDMLFPETVVG